MLRKDGNEPDALLIKTIGLLDRKGPGVFKKEGKDLMNLSQEEFERVSKIASAARYKIISQRIPLSEAVLFMKRLLSGKIDAKEIESLYQLDQKELKAAKVESELELFADGKAITVTSAHSRAFEIGYEQTPIVIAYNPKFKWPDGKITPKFTIARYDSNIKNIDMNGLRLMLKARNPKWGGPENLIASPQGEDPGASLEEIRQLVKQFITSESQSEDGEKFKDLQNIPPEVFGTPAERKERFLMLNQKIKEEAKNLGISPEVFVEKVKKAEEFMETAVLYHRTEAKTLAKMFQRKTDLRSLKKIEEKGGKERSHTYQLDRELNLDSFVFLAIDPDRFIAGDAILGVEMSILRDHPSLVTLEDIFEIMRYTTGLTQWETDLLTKQQRKEVLEEYRKQVLSGEHFYQIFCKLLGLHFKENPQEYYRDEELRSKMETSFRNYLEIKSGYPINPEIKVLGKVSFEKNGGIVVFSQKAKDLLIKAGMPSAKIALLSSKKRNDIYQGFMDLK